MKDNSMEKLLTLAKSGDSEAQLKLGLSYLTGRGIEKNSEQAFYWYNQAALNGNVFAEHNLADMYLRGDGVEKNVLEALKWFESASSHGDIDSQYNLGLIYLSGEPGKLPRDEEKAFDWFMKAAESGLPRAMYEVAVMLREGTGVEQDPGQSKKWFEKAFHNGVRRAEFALEELESG